MGGRSLIPVSAENRKGAGVAAGDELRGRPAARHRAAGAGGPGRPPRRHWTANRGCGSGVRRAVLQNGRSQHLPRDRGRQDGGDAAAPGRTVCWPSCADDGRRAAAHTRGRGHEGQPHPGDPRIGGGAVAVRPGQTSRSPGSRVGGCPTRRRSPTRICGRKPLRSPRRPTRGRGPSGAGRPVVRRADVLDGGGRRGCRSAGPDPAQLSPAPAGPTRELRVEHLPATRRAGAVRRRPATIRSGRPRSSRRWGAGDPRSRSPQVWLTGGHDPRPTTTPPSSMRCRTGCGAWPIEDVICPDHFLAWWNTR